RGSGKEVTKCGRRGVRWSGKEMVNGIIGVVLVMVLNRWDCDTDAIYGLLKCPPKCHGRLLSLELSRPVTPKVAGSSPVAPATYQMPPPAFAALCCSLRPCGVQPLALASSPS